MYFDGSVMTFFDWDDSSYKHFISDIAIIIFYQFGFLDKSDAEIEDLTYKFIVPFMKGYNEENHLEELWFEHLNDFLKLREIILFLVIYSAGDEVVDSPWGQRFLNKYTKRIKDSIPFFNQTRAIKR